MIEVNILGRFTSNAEIVTYQDTTYANFTLAAKRERKNNDGKYDVDFIDCTTSGQKANIIKDLTKKGDLVLIYGTLEVNIFMDKENNKQRRNIVKVRKIKLLNN